MSENASPTSSAPSPGEDRTVTVPALDYGAFRRLADWAGGMLDEVVDFNFDRHGTLTARVDGAARGAGVKVPAFTVARPRAVASLTLTTDDGQSVDLARGADAAFWSEAAVEKFVLPYYASLAGGRAAVVLAQLMGAWAGAPAGVQVLGLTHFAHPRQPDLTGVLYTLGVVFAAAPGGEPACVTLAEFLARYRPDLLEGESLRVPNPPPAPPRELEQPGDNAHAGPRRPSYLELRVMAEWASSLRGGRAYFVFDPEKELDPRNPYARFKPCWRLPTDARRRIVIPTYSEKLVADRPSPRAVDIAPLLNPSSVKDLAPEADAVFWGTGAVEHLLMPYYAQVYGGQALTQLQAMHRVWWEYGADPRPDPRAGGDAALEGLRVYGLLHLPSSDWTTEPTVESIADTVGVVFSQDGPELRTATLRELLERVPG